jgi:4-amino-4-deoxy-L-arabinose transferase-like glycosyltransferase
MKPNRIAFLIVLVYAALGVAFATRTPHWQAPDEPAHYNYIRQVASGTLLPVIEPGDWDNATLERLKAERFASDDLAQVLPSIQYEDHQPPLYYWVSAPVYALTGGDVVALRLVSVLWGAITAWMAYRISRRVFDEQAPVALAVMGVVAFLPQHLAINASINNDALANALIAVTLWLCLRYREDEDLHPIWFGLAIAFITLTKTTAYFMVAVVLLTLILRSRAVRNSASVRAWSGWLEASVIVAVVAFPFALFWFGRNVATYGGLDFLGLGAHDAVVVGQLRTADLVAQVGAEAYLMQALTTTYNSFWGQFGWMGVPMFGVFAPQDNVVYPAMLAFVLLASVGWLISRIRRAPLYAEAPADPTLWRDTRWILFAVVALALAQFAYYNSTFVQFQGRYLFGALVPFALFLGAGWVSALRPLRAGWGALAIVGAWAGLCAYLIWRVLPGAL